MIENCLSGNISSRPFRRFGCTRRGCHLHAKMQAHERTDGIIEVPPLQLQPHVRTPVAHTPLTAHHICCYHQSYRQTHRNNKLVPIPHTSSYLNVSQPTVSCPSFSYIAYLWIPNGWAWDLAYSFVLRATRAPMVTETSICIDTVYVRTWSRLYTGLDV